MVRIDHEYNIQPEGSVRGNVLASLALKEQTTKKKEPKRIKQGKGLVPCSKLHGVKYYFL